MATLARRCTERRSSGKTPLLVNLDPLTAPLANDLLLLAGQLTQGLAADRLANPRQIKRFLNAFGVRSAVAEARQVSITPAVLVKMLLLEDQHRTSFETLAAATSVGRRELLEACEAWARGTGEPAPPAGVDQATKDWAAAQPSLSTVNLDQYLTLAASLLNVRAGAQVSDRVSDLVQELLAEGDAARSAAVQQLAGLSEIEQRDGLDLLFASARLQEDLSLLLTAAVHWAKANIALAEAVATGIRENWARLTADAVVELNASGLAPLTLLLREVEADDTLPEEVREAARIELGH